MDHNLYLYLYSVSEYGICVEIHLMSVIAISAPEVGSSSSSTSKPTLTFPLHPPTSQSTPPLSTSIPTQARKNPTPVIVASVATTVVLLLVAVAVLTFVMVVLTRHKKKISSEPHTQIKEKGNYCSAAVIHNIHATWTECGHF